jgi:hypothetical protein
VRVFSGISAGVCDETARTWTPNIGGIDRQRTALPGAHVLHHRVDDFAHRHGTNGGGANNLVERNGGSTPRLYAILGLPRP